MPPFKQVDHPKALTIVIEPAVVQHGLGQDPLTRVTERRVPQVMGQGHAFGEILIQSQLPRYDSRDLSSLQRMRQRVPVVVRFQMHEDLGLVLQATKGGRVDDSTSISLKCGPVRVRFFRMKSMTRSRTTKSKCCQGLGFVRASSSTLLFCGGALLGLAH